MAQEMANALAYLHDRGVFHRDLKCENVLVFPGNNDGFLLKLADFGLGFLNDNLHKGSDQLQITRRIPGLDWGDVVALPHVPPPQQDLTSSQVGTVWIRAPEVDSNKQYSAAAVDVFSFGMVLVDLLTDGNGEDIRWEVTYQKKDPTTGKNLLAFGIDSKKLKEILSKCKTRLPGDFLNLAVRCCDEEPGQRPTLPIITTALAKLVEKLSAADSVREMLSQKLQRKEAIATSAAATIKSDEGTAVWVSLGGLESKEVPATECLDACVRCFENYGPPLMEEESAVISEAAEALHEGTLDVEGFARLWTRWELIMACIRDPILGWLWSEGHCALFVDRSVAVSYLNTLGADSIVFRISSTLPGKLTISVLKEGKPVHHVVSVEPNVVRLGSGKDARVFGTLLDLFKELSNLGYTHLVRRDGLSRYGLSRLATELPPAEEQQQQGSLGYERDGYALTL